MDDVTRWSRDLLRRPAAREKQRKELTTIVSINTGEPIATTSPEEDPLGFELGVGQATKPNLGTFWYCQGATLGYRVVYFYLPKTRSVAAVGLNSQPDSNESKVGDSYIDQIFEVLHHAGKFL